MLTYAQTGGNGQPIDFSMFNLEGVYHYKTKRSQLLFDFELKEMPNGRIHIYIINQPPYPTARARGAHPTHRLREGNRHYVCCAENNWPTTIPDALTWLQYWAEFTDWYMDTGGDIEDFKTSILG